MFSSHILTQPLCRDVPPVFFPFHYAPFASDFKNIEDVRSDFDLGMTPFCPLEQLMGVFPESSGKFLPPAWRQLMGADVSRCGTCIYVAYSIAWTIIILI